LEYFVVYDNNDYAIAYLDNKKELSEFSGKRMRDINYLFNKYGVVHFLKNHKMYFIYRFFC
jgi:hypothetical protein